MPNPITNRADRRVSHTRADFSCLSATATNPKAPLARLGLEEAKV
jgi:hypothetical protein